MNIEEDSIMNFIKFDFAKDQITTGNIYRDLSKVKLLLEHCDFVLDGNCDMTPEDLLLENSDLVRLIIESALNYLNKAMKETEILRSAENE